MAIKDILLPLISYTFSRRLVKPQRRKTKSVLYLEQIAVDASQSTLRASKKTPPLRWGAPGRGGFEKDQTALVILELRHGFKLILGRGENRVVWVPLLVRRSYGACGGRRCGS